MISTGNKPVSEQRYRCLATFWVMFAYADDVTQQQLEQMHRALSEQEERLCDQNLEMCMENLMQRLQTARSLGMSLSLPAWAVEKSEALAAFAHHHHHKKEDSEGQR